MVSRTPWSMDRLAASTKLPKITPSVVSRVRAFCCHKAERARPRMSAIRMRSFLRGGSIDQLSVFEPEYPIGAIAGQLFVMSDQEERRAAGADVFQQHLHDLAGGGA